MKTKFMGALLALCTLFLLSLPASAQQVVPKKYLSLASNNATLVRAGKTTLGVILPINTTSTLYYLKFYNKATAPTCGTDVPVLTVPVPNAGGAGAGVAVTLAGGMLFPTGLGFCLTGGIADTDNTNAAAGVAINLGLSGY